MTTTTAAVPETPKPIGALGRVIGAIVSPRPTFEDISRKPGWLLPVVLLIICNLGVTTVYGRRVGWQSLIEKQISQSASAQQRMSQMTPEQRADIINKQAKIAPIFGYVFGVIGLPIILLVLAGIFMGIFNATSGAEIDFKSSFGIAAHAYMPFLLATILGFVILFIKPPDQIDIQNLVASNAGAFLSSGTPRWLQSLASSFDIFTFWVLALMGFGYAVARPKKISVGKGIGWVVAIWIVYVIVKVGLAAAFA